MFTNWGELKRNALKDRDVTRSLIDRAVQADCEALVVSVDAVHFGNRERERRHYRQTMKLSFNAMFNLACHPGWLRRATSACVANQAPEALPSRTFSSKIHIRRGEIMCGCIVS